MFDLRLPNGNAHPGLGDTESRFGIERWETIRGLEEDVGRWTLLTRESWQPDLDLICVPPEHVPLHRIEPEAAGAVSAVDLCWWIISVCETGLHDVPGDAEQPRGAVLVPRPDDCGWTQGYWESGVVHWFRNRYLADETAARAVFERAVELGRDADPDCRVSATDLIGDMRYDPHPREVHLHDATFHGRLAVGAVRGGTPLAPSVG